MKENRFRPAYADLHELSEDERIELIGHSVVDHGRTVGVIVETDDAKVKRYIEKIERLYPAAKVISHFPGPVAGVTTIKVGPRVSAAG